MSQAIPLALSPILTRLYTPQDFGVLATYMSLSMLITSVISLKYEVAIIIPEKDEDSAGLTVLSILIAFIISMLVLLVIYFFNQEISGFLTDDLITANILAKWLYFIPLSILFIGIFNAISFWFNRKSLYKRMATSKVVNSTTMTITQLGAGAMKFNPIGLLLGFVTGRIFSVLYLLSRLTKEENSFFFKTTKKHMIFLMKRYKRFPYFTLPAEFINVLSNQLPIFVIGKYFGGLALGNFSLMERILNAPISLLGRSVLDVFKQRASEDYIRDGNCKLIFIKTFKTLIALSIVPTILLFFLSPLLFDIIFGEEWKLAGEFAQIYAILFFFSFTASPLSYMFNIAEKQHFDLFWQLALLLFALISFSIGVFYNDIKIALKCFVVSYSFLYIVNIYLSYTFSKGTKIA